MTTASGSDALFGLAIDSPSNLYSIGHPALQNGINAIPDPGTTTLVAAAGAAGNLTGAFLYRVAFGNESGALTSPSMATDAGETIPTGTPSLDDATFSGDYSGARDANGVTPIFYVEIDTEGTPDTFKWKKGDGSYTTGVSITGAAQLLGEGISVTFGATTGHSTGDAWTRNPALTVSAKKIELTTVPLISSSLGTRRVLDRSSDGGATWAICGALFDNTTESFTDNLATLDASKVLPSTNQTAANYGFLFVDVDSFDIDPDFSVLETNALRGSAGRPRSIPGPIAVNGSPKGDLKAAYLAPLLAAGAGKPDNVDVATGEPTVISTWAATTARRNPRTLTAYTYDGAAQIPPTLLYGLALEELSIAFAGGKIVDNTFKLVGANYGISAPAAKSSGTGTWAGGFVAMGQRYDAKADTDSVLVKITQTLNAGTVKFKVKVGASSTYDGAEYTLYVDADDRQTRGGLQFNDAIELFDELGIALGADYGSNRQPYLFLATAFLENTIAVNDVYEIPIRCLIPGPLSGDSPELYSGVPAQYVDGPRFTDAHVTITKDGSVIDATGGSLKLSFPKKQVNSLCAGARSLQDLVNDGYFAAELTVTRYLNSSEWRDLMKTDDRVAATVSFTGERIPLGQGALSTHRESFSVTIPQLVIKSAKAPKTNQSTVVETIVGEAEQPDNPANDLFTMTLKTRQGWTFPE